MLLSNNYDLQSLCHFLLNVGSGCDAGDYTSDTISLINYNINETDAGCTVFEMVEAAKSAEVSALLMMRTENDSNKDFPPNARLYSMPFV